MKLLAIGALMAFATPLDAVAQDQDVPIRRDLERTQRIEQRLNRDRAPAIDPNVTPDNPDGVVGWDGPPFNYGDPGVLGGGPLPPGSPADIDED
ncbi:hypothetical protein ASG32_31525 [Methylobacterium sp. Leaf361]|jgi:hypothetical protein|uniref:hypothetical protein n=1 Tax=Methylobacterium sp. Leaf361 TaxID=1736352 RepID=UPI0006F5D774|nr:hypothetical protein [Methylobacterium sp. Leaf361]KQS58184.1 hypothetical protein ASG32_31525 [Methylobacterium sp. Leaf361]